MMKDLSTKLIPLIQLMRLDKPIGTFLLLWPTLIALWIAGEGHPDAFIVFIFAAGVIVMRSAGCVINDIFDQKIDARVSRTQNRPLASHKVSTKTALIVFAILILIAFVLVIQLNFQTFLYSGVALLLAATYPLMKRYTHFPQVVLGLAFSWSIPMVFAAMEQPLMPQAVILFIANALWIAAYDTEYAMADRADDLKIGVKSTAILFGYWDRAMILLLHTLSLILFVYLGTILDFSLYFFIGLTIAAILALYQQFLIKDRNGHACFKAFLNNNYFGASLFLGSLLEYL